jgi:hypothetical protein
MDVVRYKEYRTANPSCEVEVEAIRAQYLGVEGEYTGFIPAGAVWR